jgi:hypothetical protein
MVPAYWEASLRGGLNAGAYLSQANAKRQREGHFVGWYNGPPGPAKCLAYRESQLRSITPQLAMNANLWLSRAEAFIHYEDKDPATRTPIELIPLLPDTPPAERIKPSIEQDIEFLKLPLGRQWTDAERINILGHTRLTCCPEGEDIEGMCAARVAEGGGRAQPVPRPVLRSPAMKGTKHVKWAEYSMSGQDVYERSTRTKAGTKRPKGILVKADYVTPRSCVVEQARKALGPGEACARVAMEREVASRKMAEQLPMAAAATVLGLPGDMLRNMSRGQLGENLTAHFMAWSAGRVNSFRTTMMRLRKTIAEYNPSWSAAELLDYITVPGFYVKCALAACDNQAQENHRRLHPNDDNDCAGGTKAVVGFYGALRFAVSNGGYALDTEAPTVRAFMRMIEKRKPVPAVTASIAEVLHCERVARCTLAGLPLRVAAADCAVMAHASLRHISAQRTDKLQKANGFLFGAIQADYKKNAGGARRPGRPFCTTMRGVSGYTTSAELAIKHAGAEYLIKDNNSSNGDPRLATRLVDSPMSHARCTVMMRAVLSHTAITPEGNFPPPGSQERTESLTPHSWRHWMASAAAARGEESSAINEIGCWADSIGETLSQRDLKVACNNFSKFKTAGTYALEGRAAAIPTIMLNNMSAVTECVAAHDSELNPFPAVGGFELLRRPATAAPVADDAEAVSIHMLMSGDSHRASRSKAAQSANSAKRPRLK